MIFDIKLLLSYDYANPAVGGRHLVRMVPLTLAAGQTLLSSALVIDPLPQERLDRTDFFGSHVTEFGFHGPNKSVSISLRARVARDEQLQPVTTSVQLATLRAELAASCDVGPQSPLHHLAPSPRVPRDAAMTDFARAHAKPGQTVAETVVAIGTALHVHMRFDATATTVDTPASEAFAKRRGVCQDFSHIMIACLRGIGIPAGYISGFLCTKPPPGKPRLEGADAMHAWVQAWCGNAAGWVEFDPTNACFAGGDHIVVARGRDYGDVAPVKGTMRISGNQQSRQAVDVIPCHDAPSQI